MFDDTKPTVPYEDATQTVLYSRKLMRTLMTVAADAISGSWQLILLDGDSPSETAARLPMSENPS